MILFTSVNRQHYQVALQAHRSVRNPPKGSFRKAETHRKGLATSGWEQGAPSPGNRSPHNCTHVSCKRWKKRKRDVLASSAFVVPELSVSGLRQSIPSVKISPC